MSEPIDLLEIALRRKADAEAIFHGTMMLQNSPDAAIASDLAMLELSLAARDVSVLTTLAMELPA
jgi:hypothetical protein